MSDSARRTSGQGESGYRLGGSILLSGSVVGQAFDLLGILLLTRMLGLEGFGLFVAARAVSGLASHLLTARCWEAVLAFWPALDREKGRTWARETYVLAVWIESALFLIGLTVLTLLGSTFPGSLGDSVDAGLLLPLAFLRPAATTFIETNQAVLRLLDRYWTGAFQAAFAGVLRFFALLGVFFLEEPNLALCLAADGVATILAAGIGLVLARRASNVRFMRFPRALWRRHGSEFRSFVGVNWWASSTQAVTAYGAELVLLVLSSEAALGAFGMARRLVGFISLALSPFLAAITPQIARLVVRRRHNELKSLLARASRDVSVVLLLFGPVMVALSPTLVRVMGGEDFNSAATPLVIMVIAVSFHFVFAWLKPTMLADKRPGWVLLAQAVMGVVLVGSSALLVPTYHAAGAAISVLLGYASRTLVYLEGFRRLIKSMKEQDASGCTSRSTPG